MIEKIKSSIERLVSKVSGIKNRLFKVKEKLNTDLTQVSSKLTQVLKLKSSSPDEKGNKGAEKEKVQNDKKAPAPAAEGGDESKEKAKSSAQEKENEKAKDSDQAKGGKKKKNLRSQIIIIFAGLAVAYLVLDEFDPNKEKPQETPKKAPVEKNPEIQVTEKNKELEEMKAKLKEFEAKEGKQNADVPQAKTEGKNSETSELQEGDPSSAATGPDLPNSMENPTGNDLSLPEDNPATSSDLDPLEIGTDQNVGEDQGQNQNPNAAGMDDINLDEIESGELATNDPAEGTQVNDREFSSVNEGQSAEGSREHSGNVGQAETDKGISKESEGKSDAVKSTTPMDILGEMNLARKKKQKEEAAKGQETKDINIRPKVENIQKIVDSMDKDENENRTKNDHSFPVPDYDNIGRGLVYNCVGKHWACLDKEEYFKCKDNQVASKQSSRSPDCVIYDVYLTNRDCSKAQLQKVNSRLNMKNCQR